MIFNHEGRESPNKRNFYFVANYVFLPSFQYDTQLTDMKLLKLWIIIIQG